MSVFSNQIKKFQKESIFDHIKDNSIQFIENSDQIILDIKRTFELRHIFCHEFATNLHVEKDEILRCFNNSKIFLNQTNNFIWDLIYPNSPETQSEMNDNASETFAKADRELNELIFKIKKASVENAYMTLNIDLLDKSISEWKKYRDVKAELDASVVEGGSMYPTIYADSLTTTTKEKIESLQNEYSIELRRYANR